MQDDQTDDALDPSGRRGLSRLRASSFGSVAEQYDRARPSYPRAALDWVLAGVPRSAQVLDLAAGTGKLTGSLVAARPDLQIVAVEPDGEMLSVLSGRHPAVRALQGSAESIGLPDGCVQAVLVGQAYHWFDPPRALPEISRVLAPGGVLGVLWNVRDDSVDWTAEYGRRVKAGLDATPSYQLSPDPPPGLAEHFDSVAMRQDRHEVDTDAEGLLALAASRSYVITAAPHEREQLFARVRELAATHPALAGRPTFALPYITATWRARRRT